MECEFDYSIVDNVAFAGGIPMVIAGVINCNLDCIRYPDYTQTVNDWLSMVMPAVESVSDEDTIRSILEMICERTLGTFTDGGCIKGCFVTGPRNQNICVIYTNEYDELMHEVIYSGVK